MAKQQKLLLQKLLLKRAQWQSSNNDFPFFRSKQNPKNEKPFVAALFVTVCRASSVFFLRAQCSLKLKTRLEIFAYKKTEETECTWATNAIAVIRTCAKSRAQRTFRNPFRDHDRGIRKIESKLETNGHWWPLDSWQKSHSRFFKLYFLKQIVTRERAYPIRDCDNLPGPTYL